MNLLEMVRRRPAICVSNTQSLAVSKRSYELMTFEVISKSLIGGRFIAFAQVNGRNVFIAFSIRAIDGVLNFRPISVRFAHDDEMEKLYEKINFQKK
jgi:uncharacterized DUF497 family protein